MRPRIAIWCVLVVFFCAGASGQADKSADKTCVLKAARLFDAKTGTLTSPGLIVIQGSRITAVGSAASLPAGAKVLDLGDATLLPGFIDAHTHLTGESSDDWNQVVLNGLQKSFAEQALDVHGQRQKNSAGRFHYGTGCGRPKLHRRRLAQCHP